MQPGATVLPCPAAVSLSVQMGVLNRLTPQDKRRAGAGVFWEEVCMGHGRSMGLMAARLVPGKPGQPLEGHCQKGTYVIQAKHPSTGRLASSRPADGQCATIATVTCVISIIVSRDVGTGQWRVKLPTVSLGGVPLTLHLSL